MHPSYFRPGHQVDGRIRGTLKEQVAVGVIPVLTLVLDRLSCSAYQIDYPKGTEDTSHPPRST